MPGKIRQNVISQNNFWDHRQLYESMVKTAASETKKKITENIFRTGE
jgi:hypothetical protein